MVRTTERRPGRRVAAARLAASERRAAIVTAAMPLFLAEGVDVSTREIADAIGIAEGTMFRVFSDKKSLIDAVLEAAMDTTRTESALASIDPEQGFEDRLA